MRKIIPIVEKLGGKKVVFSLLKEHSEDKRTTIDSLRRWEDRGRVAGAATADLMKLAERMGIEYTASDFLAAPKGENLPNTG